MKMVFNFFLKLKKIKFELENKFKDSRLENNNDDSNNEGWN